MTMTKTLPLLVTTALTAGFAMPTAAFAQSNPSVVVTVENAQPSRGTFLTPPWLGIHDGTFDTYDGGALASVPLGGNEIEALAEDGNNGPITATFESRLPNAPQVQGLPGPAGPLAPGDRASITFNVDPTVDRYFSYASMIIPSNDFFVANGNPLAHQLFDDEGNFVGANFVVSGDETNDAGTEVNDEVASNVAFLAQGGPNIGVSEALPVTTPAPGFLAPGTLSYPDGVLNYPVFGNGDFNDANDAVLRVSFRYVDLGGNVSFTSSLSQDQEVTADLVDSDGSGQATASSTGGQNIRVNVRTQGLTGPVVAAHLHLGQAGTNGPVVVDMTSGVRGNSNNIVFNVNQSSLTGSLSGQPLSELLNAMAAGNVYINVHTAANPGGEIRGQLELR